MTRFALGLTALLLACYIFKHLNVGEHARGFFMSSCLIVFVAWVLYPYAKGGRS